MQVLSISSIPSRDPLIVPFLATGVDLAPRHVVYFDSSCLDLPCFVHNTPDMSNVPNSWVLIVSFLAAVGAIWYRTGDFQDCLPAYCSSTALCSPHYASWNSWFHPAQSVLYKDGASSSQNEWNLLYHLGGNGPWIEKFDGDPDVAGVNPPDGCSVDQVHMV